MNTTIGHVSCWSLLPSALVGCTLEFADPGDLSRTQRICRGWKLTPTALSRLWKELYATDWDVSTSMEPCVTPSGEATPWSTRYHRRRTINDNCRVGRYRQFEIRFSESRYSPTAVSVIGPSVVALGFPLGQVQVCRVDTSRPSLIVERLVDLKTLLPVTSIQLWPSIAPDLLVAVTDRNSIQLCNSTRLLTRLELDMPLIHRSALTFHNTTLLAATIVTGIIFVDYDSETDKFVNKRVLTYVASPWFDFAHCAKSDCFFTVDLLPSTETRRWAVQAVRVSTATREATTTIEGMDCDLDHLCDGKLAVDVMESDGKSDLCKWRRQWYSDDKLESVPAPEICARSLAVGRCAHFTCIGEQDSRRIQFYDPHLNTIGVWRLPDEAMGCTKQTTRSDGRLLLFGDFKVVVLDFGLQT